MDERADSIQRKPPVKNASRERMRAELASLRGEAVILEARKRRLVRQKRKAKSDSRRNNNRRVHPLTVRHREEFAKRHDAELENKRLRRAVSQQLTTVKHMVVKLQANGVWLPRTPTLSNVLHDENGYRFSVLREGADRIYAQVDEVIKFYDHDTPTSFQSTLASRKVDGQELLVLESRETTVIPFDFTPCHEALWRAIQEASWSNCREAYVVGCHSDSVVLRTYYTYCVGGKTIDRTTSVVAKRFVEADRMTVVWRAVSSLSGHELDRDAYIDESGWSVMKRVVDDDANEFVVRKICTQWTPRSFSLHNDRAVARNAATNTFMNLMFGTSVSDAAAISDLMENLLIDDCMSEDVA